MSKVPIDSRLLAARRKPVEASHCTGLTADANDALIDMRSEADLRRFRAAAQQWNPGGVTSQGTYGQGLSGALGAAWQAGRVQGIQADYAERHRQFEAELKARVDKTLKTPEQARMPKPCRGPVAAAKFDKGPSLLHRLWHALTRDDGLNDYHKTKEIYERRETVLGDARSQIKGGRRIG